MAKLHATEPRRVALIAIFGAAVFISKTLAPSPMDKMLVVVQSLFLALGSLLSSSLGATKVAAVGAALTLLLRPALAPITIAFALLYGILTDSLVLIFRVKAQGGEVNTKRLIAAMTVGTAITGLASYYVSVHILALLERNPFLEGLILGVGVLSGLLGGFLAALIWRKALRYLVPATSSRTN